MIIVLEGADGAGKSSHAKRLAHELGAKLMVFPDRTNLSGRLIDSWLKGEWRVAPVTERQALAPQPLADAVVFQALQLTHRAEKIEELWEAAKPETLYVFDRYWQSGVVYGTVDGLPSGALETMHRWLPRSAVNVLLDLSPQERRRRVTARGAPAEVYEKNEAKQVQLAAAYRAFWRKQQIDRDEEPDAWPVVNADGTIDEVFANIVSVIGQVLDV